MNGGSRTTRGRGRMGGAGLGPAGKCKCLRCGKTVQHKAGTPCYKTKCSNCGSEMVRS